MAGPRPKDQFMLMAAATMQEMGRLPAFNFEKAEEMKSDGKRLNQYDDQPIEKGRDIIGHIKNLTSEKFNDVDIEDSLKIQKAQGKRI